MPFTGVSNTGYSPKTVFVQRQLKRETKRVFIYRVSRVWLVPLELNEVIFEGGLSISWHTDS